MKGLIRAIIRKYWGIDGISLFLRKQRKKIHRILYKENYNAKDLISVMCDMGMSKGSIVFIHSSMSEFYNYQGTADEFIKHIIDIIGENGTILMPAYPKSKKELYKIAKNEDTVVFDVKNTKSGAGYLTEVFRKYPGVKRSINLQHSVCAYGKLAEYFTSEHHLSQTAWDEYSPYYKLGQVEGLIFCLGLDPYLRHVTMIHCTESILRNQYAYFNSFFGNILTYKYLDESGKIGSQDLLLPRNGGIRSRKIIKKVFSKKYFKKRKLSNLRIEVIKSDYMQRICLDLAHQGVSIYMRPSTKDFIKNGKFIKKDEP